MKTSLFLILFFIFLFFGNAFAQSQSLNTKFQSWNEIQLILPLKREKDSKGKTYDKITAVFTGNLRIGRKGFDFVDNRIGVTLEYRLNKYVSLMTGVLYRKDEIVKNQPKYETRYDAA